VLGIAGVALLTGVSAGGGWLGVAGTAAVVLASISYAVSTLYGQHLIGGVTGPVLSTAALVGATAVMLPFGLAQAPASRFTWGAMGCVLALSLLGTAAAQVVWFRLLRRYGAARSSLVTYLLPATALVYGVVLLHERVTLAELGGFVLILGGVALGSGAIRLPSRPLGVTQAP
jgi:drug/metabolite transporter (DMT)-like permease